MKRKRVDKKPVIQKIIGFKPIRYLIKYRIVVLFFIILTISFYFFILKDLPSPKTLTNIPPSQTTKIYDRNGTLLYRIYVNQNRTVIPLADIPPSLRQATISIEDKNFYSHGGINFIGGIVRAVKDMVVSRNLQGGSTLTQQLVKNALLTSERTVTRKVKEMILAFLVEKIYSKDQILEMYLNIVPYGGTTWGIEEASEKYFGKKAKDLNPSESALLAGLPAAPTLYSPFGLHPELAKTRQLEVLKRMKDDGYITQNQENELINTPLRYNVQNEDIKAPHFVMYIKNLLEEKYGRKLIESGGLQVFTTLDYGIQKFAEDAVATETAKLKLLNVGNAAALVIKPPTGEILAMVGSKNYFDIENDGNVNVTLSLRQPGSAFKPINYAVGLMKGYTPATVFNDMPTCFANLPGQKSYCPQNYDRTWHGPVQMRYALGNSYNIPAVKMLALNGVTDVIATASAMGITSFGDKDRYGLSLTLGGGEVRMTELATAFGVFANAGVRKDLNPFIKITDNHGKVLEENKAIIDWEKKTKHSLLDITGPRILPFDVTYLISHMLLDNGARSAAFGDNSLLQIPGHQAVSVKTGTTDDKRDNWTIGYTPSYLTAVWVGNNDNTPMNPLLASGVTGAAPIWNKVMTYILKGKNDEWPLLPSSIVGISVCVLSGKLPGDSNCPTRPEFFIRGMEPKETDINNSKTKIIMDKTNNKPAKSGQTDNIEEQEKTVIKDAFSSYCVDCSHDNEAPTFISKWNF